MTQLLEMDNQVEGLHASAPETLPFAPSLDIRAFLLRREEGNLLVYSVSGLESQAEAMEGLGGVSRHYLNHRHEAMFASDPLHAPVFVHENERETVSGALHVRGTFSRRHALDDDLEVIPTPGHTSGATAYLWDSGEHRFLFTGDSIYLDGGEWVAAVLNSSDRASYLESLALMRDLEFDVLVPWAATRGEPYYAAPAGPRPGGESNASSSACAAARAAEAISSDRRAPRPRPRAGPSAGRPAPLRRPPARSS